ncbi:MAG: class A beta-lactamase-related serine hydrolase [Clostridia bacterium]|nr:class A beta-lactamase-related serine hydrolase [Clostridia bacterium]
MRTIRLTAAILAALLLVSCTPAAGDDPVPLDTVSPAETGAAVDTDDTEPPETPPETTEPVTLSPEPVEPPELPEVLTTNITGADAAAILAHIAEAVSAETSAAVYFTDVSGRFYFGIGEEKKYHSASTIKAPYCLWLTESGQNMAREVVFSKSTRTSSSSAMTKEHVGETFTVAELVGYTLRYSDNQAYELLWKTFGSEDYDCWVKERGWPSLRLGTGDEWASLTAKDLSLAMVHLWKVSGADGVLTEHLLHTSFTGQIPRGTHYPAAHKYGYNGGTAGYHDTAIVLYPGEPYVLTILSRIDGGAPGANDLFRTVASLSDELIAVLYP